MGGERAQLGPWWRNAKRGATPHEGLQPRSPVCERVITCRAGVTTSRTNKNDRELLTKAYIRGHFTIDQRWW